MALSPIEIALKNARGRNDARSRPEQQSRGAERIREQISVTGYRFFGLVNVCLFLGGAASPGLRCCSVAPPCRVCTAAVCVSNVQSGEARIGHRESRDLNAATFWLALSMWDRTLL
ncbi:hypothetical protein NQZ68_020762 [Dissostichus eleginoides]|nr:hypothetical protein NQZ68_020762 [Dissostichus eleginoides]